MRPLRPFLPYSALVALSSAGVAAAAVPILLPEGESVEDWSDALALTDLESGTPREGPWVVVSAQGRQWAIVVLGVDGATHRVNVAAPATAAEREEVAWLAASLLPPLAVSSLPGPVTADPPAPKPPAAVHKVAARVVAPEPVPEPVSEEPVPEEPVPEEPSPPELAPPAPSRWTGGFVATVRGGGASVPVPGAEIEAWYDLAPTLSVGLGFGAWSGGQLRGQPVGRGCERVDLRADAHAQPSGLPMFVEAGTGLSVRSFRDGTTLVTRGVVPMVGLGAGLGLDVGGGLAVSPFARFEVDLRSTELTGSSPSTAPLSPWYASAGIRLDAHPRTSRAPRPSLAGESEGDRFSPTMASGK